MKDLFLKLKIKKNKDGLFLDFDDTEEKNIYDFKKSQKDGTVRGIFPKIKKRKGDIEI